jgi:very-short-patch-repair endonuclease
LQDAHLIERAEAPRLNTTPFEAKLWRRIQRSQLGRFKFRLQHVIGNCIVDFFCPKKALIVEIDGDTHDAARDERRDRVNEYRGYHTLRYSDEDIATNLESVLAHLLSRLIELPDRWPRPNPSPKGEGK